jgi:hypothetical protein
MSSGAAEKRTWTNRGNALTRLAWRTRRLRARSCPQQAVAGRPQSAIGFKAEPNLTDFA